MEIAFIIHILERNVSSTPVQSQLGAVVIHKCKHMSKGVGFFWDTAVWCWVWGQLQAIFWWVSRKRDKMKNRNKCMAWLADSWSLTKPFSSITLSLFKVNSNCSQSPIAGTEKFSHGSPAFLRVPVHIFEIPCAHKEHAWGCSGSLQSSGDLHVS